MVKRMLMMLGIVVLVLSGLGFVKFRQINKAMQASSFTPPPESVTTVVAKNESWPSSSQIIGTVEAVQGVQVAADLPGVVSKINFESGQSVSKGDVLVELDTREERSDLAALEAQRDLARQNFARTQELVKEGVLSRSEYDRTIADQKNMEAKVAQTRATIERKTIRAPFSGVLGIRKVNLGQYLAAGTPVVQLESLNPIYVDFGVPQQQAGQVKVGQSLRVAAQDLAGRSFTGRVNAIDSVVDEATRNVQIQATTSNPDGKLRSGMFVQVELAFGASRPVIPLPASAISYAPYGDSVFVITDLKDPKGQTYKGVRQQFVKIDGSRGDQ